MHMTFSRTIIFPISRSLKNKIMNAEKPLSSRCNLCMCVQCASLIIQRGNLICRSNIRNKVSKTAEGHTHESQVDERLADVVGIAYDCKEPACDEVIWLQLQVRIPLH